MSIAHLLYISRKSGLKKGCRAPKLTNEMPLSILYKTYHYLQIPEALIERRAEKVEMAFFANIVLIFGMAVVLVLNLNFAITDNTSYFKKIPLIFVFI